MEVSAAVRSDLAAMHTTSAIRVTGREMELGEEEEKAKQAKKKRGLRLSGRKREHEK